MSKTRTNQPNNTREKREPRMVWPAFRGTFDESRNKAKRVARAAHNRKGRKA